MSLTVSLASATSDSGATHSAPTNALITIADNDSGFAFTTATNTLLETCGSAQVAGNVIRIGTDEQLDIR